MALTIISMVIYTSTSGIQISLIKPIVDKLLLGNTNTGLSLPKIDIDQEGQSHKNASPVKQFKKQAFSKFTFIEKTRRRATSSFTSIGITMVIFAPILFLSFYFQQYYRNYVMWAIVVDIRNKVCDHILPQPLSFFENRKSGDLLSRLTNDIAVTQSGLTVLFDDVLLQPLKLICGLALAFYFSWKLSLLVLIAFPVIFIPVLIMGKKIKKHGKGSLRHLSDLTDALREMFVGIRIVKAFKMEAEESREIHEISDRFFTKRMKLVKAKAVNTSTSEFVYTLGLALLIILGGYVIMSRKVTPGELGGFITAMGFMVITTVKKLAKGYASLQESLAGVNRVFELFTIEPTIKDHPEAVTLQNIHEGISFNNVSFSYDNSNEFILRDINLTINKGEVVAIVGKSGAGKSTLINLIPRFYDPVKGSVEIDGIDIRKIKHESLLAHIAIVSQQTFLFNRSLRENILYGRKDASPEEIYAAAKSANIHEFIINLPKGYDTVVGELGVKLSGGQRQRIAIARAILKNASILLLDEATSSLDYESEKLVQDALNNLIAGKTTIIVAHRLSTILHCDRIIVMKNGAIVETGSHESLMSEEGEYKRVYQLHFDTLQA
ncbi:MAG: ABC transporter ATP-binding and permease component [Candidatus Brocadia fulgida]|uniref:ABC transporter ATP-binding and permease component n=1 Tax=Candidatus Brocadia fulgida TaxID=380242 RepID=A0A0M2UWL7_9BACT|nr:MAG: ABC transporter ATP-binding and permease component [Candidatus Brocadia fulgida]MBV6518133.1 putative multidrug export ATP-binding/permease protein [Candidatus Brocadia fulgida]